MTLGAGLLICNPGQPSSRAQSRVPSIATYAGLDSPTNSTTLILSKRLSVRDSPPRQPSS
ncbi:hypothetical protein M413DRAFT_437790 [Hebeloma cylindrosporum]|uniref:Uncharacterized protein n=1 Tax=Hebeloma cylindrosporum TaxID=76867 RepID=A0A0C3CWR1_HEBCY|nr:hypothetical protein M413DRAFT_437790 [Hebeloma cylindrosporum h7]